jgi:hypothetical protein
MTLGIIENPLAGRLTGKGEKPFHLSDVPYQSKISDMKSLQPIHTVEICILKMTRTDDWPLALGSVAESSMGGIYMYIYMYVCRYIFICIYICIFTCIYTCLYMYTYIYIYVYIYMYRKQLWG